MLFFWGVIFRLIIANPFLDMLRCHGYINNINGALTCNLLNQILIATHRQLHRKIMQPSLKIMLAPLTTAAMRGSSNSSTISATSDALEPTAGDASHLTASAVVGTATQEYPMDDSDDSAESLVDVYSVDSSSDAGTQHMEEHQQLEQLMQDHETGDHASVSEQTASEQGKLKRTVNTADDDLQGSSISDENLKDSSVVKAGTDPLETDNSTFEASRDDLGRGGR